MLVDVTIQEIEGDPKTDGFRHGLNVCCARCGHEIQAGGTHSKSLRWALKTLRDQCPRSEQNYYGPPRRSFAYHGDNAETEAIKRLYEQNTGERLSAPPARPTRPPYGLTADSEWEGLDCQW